MSKLMTAAAILSLSALAFAQKETIEGIRNFTRIDASFASGGSTEPTAMTELGKRGYKTVVNLRESSESGAQISESAKAAAAAGIRFINLPLNTDKPDDAAFDRLIALVKDSSTQPVFIYCATGSRAGAVWLVKRMLIDGWPEDQAVHEAVTLGLSSPALKQFALGYVARHK